MADYSTKTKQGYRIVRAFLYTNSFSKSNNCVLVVFRRDNVGDYAWVSSYDPRTGTWGQGHYMYESEEEAVFDLQRSFSPSRSVRLDNVFHVVTDDYDGYGWFDGINSALKRAYEIACEREEPMFILDSVGPFGKVTWRLGGCTLIDRYGGRFFVFPDGSVRRIGK